jgi:hypothetical protein
VTRMRLNNLRTSTPPASNKSLVGEAYRRSSPWTGGRHASSAAGIVCLSNRCHQWRREHVSRPPGACLRCPRALAAGRRCPPRRLRMRRRGRGRPGHRVSQGGTMRRALAVLVGGLLMLAGCVTLPVGPNVAVLPAPEKPQEVFVVDDAACREDAAQQSGLTQPHIMAQRAPRSGPPSGRRLAMPAWVQRRAPGPAWFWARPPGLAPPGGSRGALTGPTSSAGLPRETRCRAFRGSRRLRRPPGCHHRRLARDSRDGGIPGPTVVYQQHAGHAPSIPMRLAHAQTSPQPRRRGCTSPGVVAQRVS